MRACWRSSAPLALMNPDADLDWVVATSGLLANAETYVYMIRTIHWTPEQYGRWRYRTWLPLATNARPR